MTLIDDEERTPENDTLGPTGLSSRSVSKTFQLRTLSSGVGYFLPLNNHVFIGSKWSPIHLIEFYV